MNSHVLKQAGKNVSLELLRLIERMIEESAAAHSAHTEAINDKFKQHTSEFARMGESLSGRIQAEATEVLENLRKDVRRIGEERDAAFEHKLEALKVHLTSIWREDVESAKREMRAEAQAAARSAIAEIEARFVQLRRNEDAEKRPGPQTKIARN